MRRVGIFLVAAVGLVMVEAGPSWGQEPPAAKATRQRLQQKITLDLKEVGTKDVFDEIKREMDKPVSFRIDNASGVSNNTKLTFLAKDQPVEKVLNDLSDKYEFGWFVYYNPKDKNDRYNGWVVIRKAGKKERGYEAGKEPTKEKSSLEVPPERVAPVEAFRIEAATPERIVGVANRYFVIPRERR